MCGIVGYIGSKESQDIILDGLKRLEYRGYDSAGIAVINNGKINVVRSEGKIKNLEDKLIALKLIGSIGIGHTRWATHGRPSVRNAHPQQFGSIAIVHNGIIENYSEIKHKLTKLHHTFNSDTDTEIVAHLIERYMSEGNDFEEAVRAAAQEIEGSFSICALCQKENKIIAFKYGTPMVLGFGKGENFIASDVQAILKYTKKIVTLDDHEMAICTPEKIIFKKLDGTLIEKKSQKLNWSIDIADKSGYAHYMLKEIFEQPSVMINTIDNRIDKKKNIVQFAKTKLTPTFIKKIDKIYIVACGSSYHAGLTAKYYIEQLCKVSCEVDLASEFRYREPVVSKRSLVILVSQSGETADSLAALREAKKRGAFTLAICNVKGSSMTREARDTYYTYAGPEIGVASTKAFTAQMLTLLLTTLYIAQTLKRTPQKIMDEIIHEVIKLPLLLDEVLTLNPLTQKIAEKYFKHKGFLYIARGINFPIALEGALKLKEVSYIHAEGYASGELKHGPIAMVDEDMAIIVIAPKNELYEKVISNLQEVKARGGKIIGIGTKGDEKLSDLSDDTILLTKTLGVTEPLLSTIIIQLLAYYIAVKKGTDVDQPRNLAKSVTVE